MPQEIRFLSKAVPETIPLEPGGRSCQTMFRFYSLALLLFNITRATTTSLFGAGPT
jgi:hypothetical protein